MFKNFLKSIWSFFKKIFTFVGIISFFAVLIFVFRFPIMTEMSDFLINEDGLLRSNAIVVLSGAPFERCGEAARLYKQDAAGVIVTTGEYTSSSASIINKMPIDDAHLARIGLINLGIDSTKIVALGQGTSTYEEAGIVLSYARQKNCKRLIIVSSLQHTGRVHAVFTKKFKHTGIEIIVRGAPPLNYKPEKWWEYEEGIFFVINEYIKWLYYIVKGRIF